MLAAHASEIWDRPGAIVRASWLPANIANGLMELNAGLKPCATVPAAGSPAVEPMFSGGPCSSGGVAVSNGGVRVSSGGALDCSDGCGAGL